MKGIKRLKNNLLTAISVTTSRFLSIGGRNCSCINHIYRQFPTISRNKMNSQLKFKTLAETNLSGEKKRAHAISLYTQISFHNFILQREGGKKK